MNKKLKFLSTILCGGILASNLSLISVQAAPINNNLKLNNTFASIVNSKDTYSTCCLLDTDTTNALRRYFRKTPSPNINGVKDILTQNSIPTNTANRIAPSLYLLISSSRGQDGTLDPFSFVVGQETAVLESQKDSGTFTLATWSTSVGSNQYSNYARIPASDLKIINEEMRTKGNSWGAIYNILISKGICTDEDKAEHIAVALSGGSWDVSEDLLVLSAKQGRTNSYCLAHLPR